ncbi:YihY/virulence factor BrkB family protein [soil metagenome]
MITREQVDRVLGRDVYGRDGRRIGTVRQVFLDETTHAPEWLRVRTARAGGRELFVPLEGASLTGDRVNVPVDADVVRVSPQVRVRGDRISLGEEAQLVRHYGLAGASYARSANSPAESEHRGAPPGADADRPSQIPARGWRQVLLRAWKEAKADHVPLLAAGVAFYAFLALFPALIAAVLVYGLVSDPAQVQQQIESFASALPDDAKALITDQLTEIAGGKKSSLGFGLAVSLLGALWSASGGVMGLIKATNIAYDEEETRGFVKLRGLALLLTLGAIVFIAVAIALVAVLPVVLDAVGLGGVGAVLIGVGRWVGLVLAVMAALAVVYRVGPDRDAPQVRWVSVGAVVATVLWVIASVGLSIYVSNFGSYGKTYGALAGVVVLMLWLFVSSFIVLFGAEINAEAEQQTTHDTTTGEPEPMGQRRAVKADTLAEPTG